MLEVSFDLVPSTEVEKKGERVDIQSSSDENGNLTARVKKFYCWEQRMFVVYVRSHTKISKGTNQTRVY